jgi:hypothetical protein
MKPMFTSLSAAGAIIAIAAAAGCGSDGSSSDASTEASDALPKGADPVSLDPAEFTTEIDNPWWPMSPGSRWVYDEVEGGEHLSVDVTVTDETKVVDGIEARVVHDVVTDVASGQPLEVTDDYYAQDADGNVWYLGEKTAEYKNGKPANTSGSFEAGVDGAEAGVIMPADPQPGLEYREEYYPGEAEDAAKVLSLDEQAEVPAGHYSDVLMTSNVNPLEPKVQEYKFYARGVGPVLALHASPDIGSEGLVKFTP